MTVLLTVTVQAAETALKETFEELGNVRFEMENTVTMQADQEWPHVWIRGYPRGKIEIALRADSTISSFEYIASREDDFLYSINVTEDRLTLVDLVQEENGVILTAVGFNGRWELRIRFADNTHLTRFHNRLKESGITLDVKRIQEFNGDEKGTELLTGPQREALEAAVEHGYFAIPRQISLEELADEVGISHQALSERLRRASERLAQSEIGQPIEEVDHDQ
ncbi:helix-turn-helix domain-containing protein [Halalkalicoccus jeotgali]|uniref:Bacterio-opsin activator HTH domain protein n=1 Tax=Halalkalicoccus jeotgali (strain DSM 18796 / CECT 7217 / JCM 14584 / KCTC 4019 / B3) TaxID=795797 RepID=D8JB66_HALJB|nr:helix-turn-helix domain-containing protein [Halalkalicoccus jeotgali]ADJ16519.1 Bacterio-opsin activator HTH domain protein [Halalkalicoccus jeotgali B3]ELY41386.1 Bacterio-opsin activator HTH domain-containing protein [Halalkalicoccus jeotgali B3]